MPGSRIVVVGAGVIGLTVAVRLLEAGHDVEVFARDLPLETTSAVAAAIWYPYRIDPFERVHGWSRRSLAAFEEVARDETSGVVLRSGVELLREPTRDPWWGSMVSGFERATALPSGYSDGWTFVTPIIEMPVHLLWLQSRVEALGGSVTRMALPRLPNEAPLVINCTGLGSRGLAGDASLEPVRGQVVIVSQVGLSTWLLDGSGLTYVVPRSRDIVVGGTDVEGDWDRRSRPSIADEMLARATTLVPELDEATVLGHKVGLRPGRPTVRLEVEVSPGRRIVHCYGHGGAGVTVSWGCADEVVALVAQTA